MLTMFMSFTSRVSTRILPMPSFLFVKPLEKQHYREAKTCAPALQIKQVINSSINKATQQSVPNGKASLGTMATTPQVVCDGGVR